MAILVLGCDCDAPVIVCSLKRLRQAAAPSGRAKRLRPAEPERARALLGAHRSVGLSQTSSLAPYSALPLQTALAPQSARGTQNEEDRLSDELFAKGIGISHPTLRRTVLAAIDESIDKEEAPVEKCSRETEKYLCTICMTSDRRVVFMPCSHFVTCKLCSESCDSCPVCRTALMGKLEVFL